ncbi:MAG: hypothetical protein KatS3mg111_1998 [Pirellulaceae bacterium]|nr:MAG: hypothetical protein KatS3mg111_1998 [Pirellulaceae bacterium]
MIDAHDSGRTRRFSRWASAKRRSSGSDESIYSACVTIVSRAGGRPIAVATAIRSGVPMKPVLVMVALGMLLVIPRPASGQYRSGTTVRQRYPAVSSGTEHERGEERRIRAAGHRRGSSRNVQSAAYRSQDSGAETSSVVESVKAPEGPSAGLQARYRVRESTPVFEEVWDEGASYETRGAAVEACGAFGCDGFGCDCCGGGYSAIAPTCTTPCPPGCGPLMALWYRLRVRAELPLYWRRAHGPPALVTTSPAGTAPGVAGELGQPTTQVLFGEQPIGDDVSLGMRLTFSTWLDESECFGVDVRYWNAGDRDDLFAFDSSDFPILARPFLNTTVLNTPTPDAQLVAYPGDSEGAIDVLLTSRVDGVDLGMRRLLYRDRYTRVDWLSGYKYVGIDEGLIIESHTLVTGNNNNLQGATIDVRDQFDTENRFHGGTYGIMSTRRIGRLHIETMFRMGLGNLTRRVRLRGTTTTASGGATNVEPQGLLVRDTNSQPFTDDTFIIVPEVGINLGWALRPGLDFTVGYHYMLIPKVAQASRQLDKDLAVNLSDPLVGSLDPQLDFEERKYWLNSLGLGLQLRY